MSAYTKELIVESATEVDAALGTRFAEACRARVGISYPAVDSAAFVDLDPASVRHALGARGLEPGSYALFLSRITSAKGVADLIDGFAMSRRGAGDTRDRRHGRRSRGCDAAGGFVGRRRSDRVLRRR
ncbi:MAG: hypothetical protein R2710_24900 [Acidimicrobiales bacterium]